MPPIHYLPHELSPLLKVLGDRVIEVVGMGTSPPSDSHPQISRPDIQVALMKTEYDVVLRVAAGFAQAVPQRDRHWYQIMGTEGCLEWRRWQNQPARIWLADSGLEEWQDVDWTFARQGLPGLPDANLTVHAEFHDALVHGHPRDLEMYSAMDTAAPAILAAESIDDGGRPRTVPDFRPGPARESGQAPSRGGAA
jgi:predicted dehydrogenase